MSAALLLLAAGEGSQTSSSTGNRFDRSMATDCEDGRMAVSVTLPPPQHVAQRLAGELLIADGERALVEEPSSSSDSSPSQLIIPHLSKEEATDYLLAMEALSLFRDEFRSMLARNTVEALSLFKDQFRSILIRNTVIPVDPGSLLSSSYTDDAGDCVTRLIDPDAVPKLEEIASGMIMAGQGEECFRVYSAVRSDALDECLNLLLLRGGSVETLDVRKMEWSALDEIMRNWVRSLNIIVKVIIPGEKRLGDRIFAFSEATARDECFVQSTECCIKRLLSFAGTVAREATRSCEKLFRILDMHAALEDVLLSHLQSMFPGEHGELVRRETEDVLGALGDAAKEMFADFEKAVEGETSKRPVHAGAIHPMTRYVMNYIKLLMDDRYRDHLNRLLLESDESSECCSSCGRETTTTVSMEDLPTRLETLISAMEKNLEEKSEHYDDGALRYVSLMNNMLYAVHKVRSSELGKILGSEWMRKRRGQIQQYARFYLRASWSKSLHYLREGEIELGDKKACKDVLKERFRKFNARFEQIYRTQTGWKVADPQLREELIISVSDMVIPAYRSFIERFGSRVEGGKQIGKHVKYSPDDLLKYLHDLFRGSTSHLHHHHPRS